MPTGHTTEQLQQLTCLFEEAAPRLPAEGDIEEAAVPPSITTATTPNTGTLVNFGGAEEQEYIVLLNPVVALELIRALLAAGQENGWWDAKGN